MFHILDHKLSSTKTGQLVIPMPCDKHSGPMHSDPEVIVIHYTASMTVESAVNTLTDPDVKASAHLVIDTDGAIYQLLDFNLIGWHAGRSEYRGMKGLNKNSIGIELVNPGWLYGNLSGYQTWSKQRISSGNVITARHKNEEDMRYWHTYSAEQLASTKAVCKALVSHYNIQHIVGHDEIAPGRKWDPGPAFPMEKFRKNVLNNDRPSEKDNLMEHDVATVTGDRLNFRAGPYSAALSTHKLKKGAEVTVVNTTKDKQWVQVITPVIGWVHSNYLRKVDE